MISTPPKGDASKKLGSYFTPLKVEPQASPNMTVKVSAGSFWTAARTHMEYIGGTSPTITAPTSDAKWVLLTINDTGVLNVVNGIASSTPVLPVPSLYQDELPLAAIFVGDTTTAITADMVFDVRPLWSVPPDSVSQTQLNDFATIVYVNNGLATKTDFDNTPSPTFTLNYGGSTINYSGLYIDRDLLPTVWIRFNETAEMGSPPVVTPRWDFTNDGVVWKPLGSAVFGTLNNIPTLDTDGDLVDSGFGIEWTIINVAATGSPVATGTHEALPTHDLLLIDASAGDITISLHPVTDKRNRPLNIKRVDNSGNTVTVTGAGSPADTIDNATFKTIVGQYTNMIIMNDNSTWHIL